MCGIAGYIKPAGGAQAGVIHGMCGAIAHRGPDAYGEWHNTEGSVVLGHRRLSIRDLSNAGAQPMESRSGRYVLSYNGEIYNADELRSAVDNKCSLSWRGSSDTEVLLEAIAQLGLKKVLDMAKGMFAFALYDKEKKCLTLARDRIGEKPLYYGFAGDDFVFASELSAIEAYPGFNAEVDGAVLPQYMLYGYIPAPASIYKGIHKLPPGTALRIYAPYTSENVKYARYYELRDAAAAAEADPFKGSFREAADELERLLKESIRGQLASDVPLGAYLSGGIDSATVVALMCSLRPGGVESFTIGFDDPKYDESAAAAAIAARLGTKHHCEIVSEGDLKAVIPRLPEIYSEPFADSSQIPTYMVSALAKKYVTVVLSGDAGDELFCGYRTYPQIAKLWNVLRFVPSTLRRAPGAFLARHTHGATLYRAGCCLQAANAVELKEAVEHSDPYMERLAFSGVPVRNRAGAGRPLTQMMNDDMLRYHPEDILVKVDRAGMAASLENRIPMLDKDVLEFALRLPAEYKYDGKIQKKILKEVLYRYVPKELMERPKQGFAVPLSKWLKEGDTAQWAEELMLSSKAAQDGLLDTEAVNALWNDFKKSKRSPRLVWKVLMLEQWYRSRKAGA